MNRTKYWIVSALVVASVSMIAISANSAGDEFTVRKTSEQVVLYTIYRGSYDTAHESIGKLFALVGQKGFIPCGPVSYAYLNNPKLVTPQHCLTEIRIPVKAEALKSAGTLGEFTDIKKLPSMDVVVAQKSEGVGDPSGIYDRLRSWIAENGYVAIDGASETFLTSGGGNYAQMKTEIMIPVIKLNTAKK